MDELTIIQEVQDLYGEWLDMAGSKAHILLTHILAKKLLHERELNIYYKKRLDKYDMVGR